MAMGADVVSGVKTVPDLEFCRHLDPEGRYLSIYNRYSFAVFVFNSNLDSIDIRAGGFPIHLVRIHPRNAVLRARNVRYFIFSKPLADPQHEGMKLVKGFPQNHMWIYDAMPERACDRCKSARRQIALLQNLKGAQQSFRYQFVEPELHEQDVVLAQFGRANNRDDQR